MLEQQSGDPYDFARSSAFFPSFGLTRFRQTDTLERAVRAVDVKPEGMQTILSTRTRMEGGCSVVASTRIRSISWICTSAFLLSQLRLCSAAVIPRFEYYADFVLIVYTLEGSRFDAAGESGQNEEGEITLPALRRQLIQFERAVKKNQEMRVKFPDEPEKYVPSPPTTYLPFASRTARSRNR
jgi:hypothetical protein